MIILHVDDDSDDREMFREALNEVDPSIECLDAEDGLEAHTILTDGLLVQNLGCIFVDINMPLLDGISLVALIKADQRLSKVPIYVYSTSNEEREVTKVKELGACFIQKHSDYKGLVKTLRAILEGRTLQNTGRTD